MAEGYFLLNMKFRLQVRKFCNHLVELHLLFGSKRSPSVLDLIIISILKPGKPAGSARVLICNRCHHKLIYIYAVQRYEKDLNLIALRTIIFQFLYFTLHACSAVYCLSSGKAKRIMSVAVLLSSFFAWLYYTSKDLSIN